MPQLPRQIIEKRKKPVILEITSFFGAVTQIRTGDLILTKIPPVEAGNAKKA